ncbi:hypothetical protein DL98DRAFT_597471 [Cadophora sp. DSE1049]|nr:hypothetical protein DL98DRAFT_597471 [Cadophora sp. DSE1049]
MGFATSLSIQVLRRGTILAPYSTINSTDNMMKLALSACLILLLRLASTFPLPSLKAFCSTENLSKSCIISLLAIPHNNPYIPPIPSTVSNFPLLKVEDDMIPQSLTMAHDATQALSSSQPLSTLYLLSLKNPASEPTIQKSPMQKQKEPKCTTDKIPAKSSALAGLRGADRGKHWVTLRPAHALTYSPTREQVQRQRVWIMGGRQFTDLMVIVLVVTVVLAVIERCGNA